MSIYYLVSSLPSFNFGDRPYYSSDAFVRLCSDWISSSELQELEAISLNVDKDCARKSPFTQKWNNVLCAIVNSTAKIRASALSRDISNSLKEQKAFYSEIDKGVQDAFSADNPMEREKKLDQLKWFMIDLLEAGHQFDFEKLCAYKLKILICENWLPRVEAEGRKNLDEALAQLYKPSEES